MAIKVNGTEVITDSRKLVNIADTDNTVSSDFYPNSTVITNTINFTTPFMTATLTGNTTFAVSGVAAGKSAVFAMDISTTPHAPTFSSEFNWAGGTEPTWSDYRRWQIHMICHDANRVDATAFGFSALTSTPTEAVALSGTSGNPVTFMDMPSSNANDLIMGWTFGSNGNIYKYESIYNQGGSGTYLHSSTQWNNITPSQTYYIKVTNSGGTKNVSTPDSDAINSWIALTSDREYRVRDARDITTYADENMIIKVEIASDSGGSNILDTGYYECEYNGLA